MINLINRQFQYSLFQIKNIGSFTCTEDFIQHFLFFFFTTKFQDTLHFCTCILYSHFYSHKISDHFLVTAKRAASTNLRLIKWSLYFIYSTCSLFIERSKQETKSEKCQSFTENTKHNLLLKFQNL